MNDDKQSSNTRIDDFLRQVTGTHEREQFEQGVRSMSEILWFHYSQCRKAGFSRLESLALTRDYYAYCLNQTRSEQ